MWRWIAAASLIAVVSGCFASRAVGEQSAPAFERGARGVTLHEDVVSVSAAVWSAERPDFGGFSGLVLEEGDGFVALTDKAHWARARFRRDAEGRLIGATEPTLGRLQAAKGVPIDGDYKDSEALTRTRDGAWLIAFEGIHRILRFDDLKLPGERIPAPAELSDLSINDGLESLLALPDGRLIAIAEDSMSGTGGFPGWILHPDAEPERFTVQRHGWFKPTDLALDPGGDSVYLLERRFTLIGGFAMRLRRIPLAAFAAGSRIEGETLIEIVDDIDNMEGLDAVAGADGAIRLYAISDDNFTRSLQRTLLLEIRLQAPQ